MATLVPIAELALLSLTPCFWLVVLRRRWGWPVGDRLEFAVGRLQNGWDREAAAALRSLVRTERRRGTRWISAYSARSRCTTGGVLCRSGAASNAALLALLLLRANEVVPVERIIDELWPEAPPLSATKSVHALVSRLRSLLESEQAGREEARATTACC